MESRLCFTFTLSLLPLIFCEFFLSCGYGCTGIYELASIRPNNSGSMVDNIMDQCIKKCLEFVAYPAQEEQDMMPSLPVCQNVFLKSTNLLSRSLIITLVCFLCYNQGWEIIAIISSQAFFSSESQIQKIVTFNLATVKFFLPIYQKQLLLLQLVSLAYFRTQLII